MSGLECDVVEGCGLSFPQFSHPDPQNPKTLCIKCEALGRDQEVDEGRRGPQIRKAPQCIGCSVFGGRLNLNESQKCFRCARGHLADMELPPTSERGLKWNERMADFKDAKARKEANSTGQVSSSEAELYQLTTTGLTTTSVKTRRQHPAAKDNGYAVTMIALDKKKTKSDMPIALNKITRHSHRGEEKLGDLITQQLELWNALIERERDHDGVPRVTLSLSNIQLETSKDEVLLVSLIPNILQLSLAEGVHQLSTTGYGNINPKYTTKKFDIKVMGNHQNPWELYLGARIDWNRIVTKAREGETVTRGRSKRSVAFDMEPSSDSIEEISPVVGARIRPITTTSKRKGSDNASSSASASRGDTIGDIMRPPAKSLFGTSKSRLGQRVAVSAGTVRRVESNITYFVITRCTLLADGSHRYDEDPTVIKGALSVAPLNTSHPGVSKRIFRLFFGGNAYVAKHVVKLSDDDDATPVTTSENLEELELELARLGHLRAVLLAFQKLCESRQLINVYNLTVTDAFIIQVVKDETSGEKTGVAYLVEPERLTSVIKFSSTLDFGLEVGHPAAKTVSALTHFSIDYPDTAPERELTMIADVQGSIHTEGVRETICLFDTQMHSVRGITGAGDHGIKGMQAFLNTHKCNSFCKSLKLRGTGARGGLRAAVDKWKSDLADEVAHKLALDQGTAAEGETSEAQMGGTVPET